MTYQDIENLSKKYGTPFYLMDGETYLRNITDFQNAFLRKYNKLVVGYSFKTNYVPALCKIAMEAGCYAEVVSEMEYDLAKRIGFKNVIYNGPIKKKASLKKAFMERTVVNLDSMYELDTLLEYIHDNNVSELEVGLRLNIDLTDDDGTSKIQCGLRTGRFGFTHHMLKEVIPILRNNRIKIISLHGHTSSSDRAVTNFALITNQMLAICESFQLNDLRYFDIGGGFFGASAKGMDVSDKPKYIDYADCILDICLQNDWFKNIEPYIVIEPGVSVVANVFSYVSQIFQTKEIANKKFLTTDGTVFDIKPTLHPNNLTHAFITATPSTGTYKADLVGSTCMEKDVMLNNVEVPENIKYGDFVKIDGVGAYTIVLTPTFINYVSPIIDINNQRLIRRRQTLEDVLKVYAM